MGAGGVIPPGDGLFPGDRADPAPARHPASSRDEVICGFGRTGEVWGCESYDFTPDAIISSKALTAGYFPMGAVILGPDLADRLQRRQPRRSRSFRTASPPRATRSAAPSRSPPST